MAAKQNPGRFTIQFNMNDPMQIAASNTLDRQGRRKAQYITNAIAYYQFHCDAGSQEPPITPIVRPDKITHNEHSPEEYHFFAEAKKEILRQPDSPANKSAKEERDELDALFEGSELPAIADTLAAFGMAENFV